MKVESFFATAPKGIESVLAEELSRLGAERIKKRIAGVSFSGQLELGYRACLWLRTANRVLLNLKTIDLTSSDDLYAGVQSIDWSEHLSSDGTFAVDFSSLKSCIKHSHYGALKTKDAIVDQFRDKFGARPSIDVMKPDIRINISARYQQAFISIDLSGQSLHKRGYRSEGGLAPLKENLAAAILLKSGWKSIAENGGALIDPMCGSGTFPIEAAMIAADMAPGLLRDYFGFLGWLKHQPDLWQSLLDEAEDRESRGVEKLVPVIGFDDSAAAVKDSVTHTNNAGLSGFIQFSQQPLSDLRRPQISGVSTGLLVINPPYGERLGKNSDLSRLYRQLANTMKQEFTGWKASVFTGNKEFGKHAGLKPVDVSKLYNGSLACELLIYHPREKNKPLEKPGELTVSERLASVSNRSEHVGMFTNRLKKNLKKLKSWRQRNNITCFRAYDRDIPEFAVAIDAYERWLHVQEYKAPASVPSDIADQRLNEIISILPEMFDIPIGNIFLKQRSKQKSSSQYEKRNSKSIARWVNEAGLEFEINLENYIDTGLFLDHRVTRAMIEKLAAGKRFLNLFSYTGTATVYAARGGAVSTVSVDKSKTYTSWAKRNLKKNGFDSHRHIFHSEDCLKWIQNERDQFDLIFLDPPTFSNTKKSGQQFEIQSDHAALITSTSRLLADDGILIFSNNYRNFKINRNQLEDLRVEDITAETIPVDFERNPKIHNVWRIQKK